MCVCGNEEGGGVLHIESCLFCSWRRCPRVTLDRLWGSPCLSWLGGDLGAGAPSVIKACKSSQCGWAQKWCFPGSSVPCQVSLLSMCVWVCVYGGWKGWVFTVFPRHAFNRCTALCVALTRMRSAI